MSSVLSRLQGLGLKGLGLTRKTGVGAGVAFGIIGQSNEHGLGRTYVSGPVDDPASYVSLLSTSLTNPTIADPIAPASLPYMSMWPKLVDLLAANGAVQVPKKIVNGGLGSVSFRRDVCGQVQGWAANREFFQARASEGAGDYGDMGDTIRNGSFPNRQRWRCITGAKRYVSLSDASPAVTINGTPYTNLDYKLIGSSKLSGSVEPLWASVTTIGDSIADGALVWQLIENNAETDGAGTVFTETHAEFDPVGILRRLKASLNRVAAREKWVLISNGQADLPASEATAQIYQGWYTTALTAIANWCLNQRYKVMIGLTCYNPAASQYQYDVLDSAWVEALVGFSGNPNVRIGANLFRTMGNSPLLYPEAAAPLGVHLTDLGLLEGAQDWADAVIADALPATVSPYQAETRLAINRMIPRPDDARKTVINNLIVSLKSGAVSGSNILAKMDALYLLGAHNANAALVNLAQNAYDLSLINAPTFTEDEGYVGNGSTSYLKTNFNPSTAIGAKYQRDDAHQGIWSLTDLANGAGASLDIGESNSAFIRRNSGVAGAADFRAGMGSTGSILTSYPGHTVWTRESAAQWRAYKAGAQGASGTNASIAPANQEWRILAVNGSGFGVNKIFAAHWGALLSANEVLDLYNALNTYRLAIV